MINITLIRHGSTDFNRERRYQGWSNPSLCDDGTTEVHALARELSLRDDAGRFNSVYSSDLSRATQTATILFPDTAINISSELRELHFGVFEGLTHEECMQKHGPAYTSWIESPECVVPPSGESLASLRQRVTTFIHRLFSNQSGQKIALVTHGGLIKVLLQMTHPHAQMYAHGTPLTLARSLSSRQNLLPSIHSIQAPPPGGFVNLNLKKP